MEQDSPQPVGADEMFARMAEACEALYDVANPPGEQLQIPIQGIGETLIGERGLRNLPYGTMLRASSPYRARPHLYLRIKDIGSRQWVDGYGHTLSSLDVFTNLVNEARFGGTITALTYGTHTIEELQAKP